MLKSIALVTAVTAWLCGCAPQTDTNSTDLRLSQIELANGAADAALRSATAALQAAPRDAHAWAAVAAAQAALGEADTAQESYRHAVAIDPDDLDARLGLIRLRMTIDAVGSGNDLLSLAAQHPHDARIWTDLGVAYDLQLRPTQAQDAYRRGIAENPLLISAQADLGLSLALSGHAHEGVAMLAPLANGPASTPRIRQDYGFALALAGDTPSARFMLARDLPPAQILAALDRVDSLRDAAR